MKDIEKYILIHKKEKGDTFLYNSVTRSSIVLPSSLNINSVEDIRNISDEKILNMLKEDLIVLDNNVDYLRLGRYLNNKSKYYQNTLTITDAVTFNCNLKCAYCMEQNRVDAFNPKYMDINERITIWKKLHELSHLDNIRVIFFGGEPFFNIEYVSELMETAVKEGLPISSYSAVTNGTRCNDEFINLLNKYPFKQLQITLDGTCDIHDKRRVDKANNGTWNQIMDNIERLLNETKVTIVVNSVIDKENCKNHEELIDVLIERFPKYMFGDESRIMFNIGMACSPEGACEFTDKNIPDRIEYIDIYMPTLKKAIEKNVKINNFIPTSVCIYNTEQELILAPDGDIYKCISAIGVDQFKVASKNDLFEKPEKFIVNLSNFVENADKECLACDYTMYCNGGCKFNAYVKGTTKECNKNYIKHLLPHLVEAISMVEEVSDNVFAKKATL